MFLRNLKGLSEKVSEGKICKIHLFWLLTVFSVMLSLKTLFNRNYVNRFFNYLIIWTALFANSASSYAKDVNPESLQAAYIQKFINYIEWPASTDDKFTIGVLNNPTMYEALTDTFANSVVLGKQVQVISLQKIDKKESYNILHTSKVDHAFIKELAHSKLHGLLVVAQHDTGSSDQVQINFFIDDNGKLRFDINQTSALDHGLRINSRLLNLARSLK